MSETISQEQLDSLLEQQEAGAFDVKDVKEDSKSVESEVQKHDYSALKTAFEFFNEQAGTSLSALLNREIKLDLSECTGTDQEKLKEAVNAPVLSIAIPFKEGLSGTFYVIMCIKNVAVFSDIMMMGDGTAEYNEDHKDAIGELFNQLITTFCSALSNHCGETVSIETVDVKEFDFNEPSVQLNETDMVIEKVSLTGIGDISFGFIIPNDLSTQFMNKFKVVEETGKGEGVGLSSAEVDDLTKISADVSEIQEDETQFQETELAKKGKGAPKENIEMLLDVEMDICIELGRTEMSIKRILEMAPGSIIELDRMAGEPVDLVVNNKVVAKGEVVIVDENFGIRIVSLVSPEERIKSLR